MKEDKHGTVMCTVVPKKGASYKMFVRAICDWMDSLGHEELILKCDNESSITELQKEIQNCRKGKTTIPECSPVGESSSNGLAETTVREVEAFIRTLKFWVEGKAGFRIDNNGPLMGWIVRHVGTVLSRIKVNTKTGLTPYESLKGKTNSAPMVPFGESIMFRSLRQDPADKRTQLDERFEEGIYLGILGKTGEAVMWGRMALITPGVLEGGQSKSDGMQKS